MSNASSSLATNASPDRRSIWQRRFAATCVGGALVAGGLMLWALAPLPVQFDEIAIVRQPIAATSSSSEPERPRVLDRQPFTRQLWWTLPKPTDAAANEAAAKLAKESLPLELDLIGVSDVDGTLVAALYDRRADRLRLVRQGERFLEADVAEVTRERVRLTRQDGELLLTRRRPGP